MSHSPKVSIIVPNYKTAQLTKICLRLLHKYTNPELAKVIVVDNGSKDESTEYLRTLKWITLIERDISNDPNPAQSHARALDEAMQHVDTPYVLLFHTDTLVRHPRWLEVLLREFEKDDNMACVGSWKLEFKPLIKRIPKQIETAWQSFYFKLINKTDHKLEGKGNNFLYARSHCALYKTELLQHYNLTFAGDETVGKGIYKALSDNGHNVKLLSSEYLCQYLDHINHATMIINPELSAHKKTKKGLRRIKKRFQLVDADKILATEELDR